MENGLRCSRDQVAQNKNGLVFVMGLTCNLRGRIKKKLKFSSESTEHVYGSQTSSVEVQRKDSSPWREAKFAGSSHNLIFARGAREGMRITLFCSFEILRLSLDINSDASV